MVKPPPLVWADGRPMVRDVLEEEIAGPSVTGVRSILSGHPAQGLTPQRLAGLLRGAEAGDAIAYLELAEEMEEKDLHYLSQLGTRKRQIAQLPITVEPAGEDEEAKADAKLVEDWIARDTLQAELFDILDAIGKGYSATELVWRYADGLLLPAQLKWRDPRWFEFDRADGETLRLRDDNGQLAPMPPAKFIVHVHPAKSGLPIRGGLARAIAWGWMFKNYSTKDWIAFLEMYGLPMRIGKYPVGTSDAHIRLLQRAVAQLGTDAAAVFPEAMSVDFVQGGTGAAPADLWLAFIKHTDDQISKAVLGQTSSADAKSGGIGSGQADLHDAVRKDIETADAQLLATSLNRDLVPAIVMVNRGPRARYPRIKIGRPDEVDIKAMTEAVTALVPLGVEVSRSAVRERAGLPAPTGPDDILKTGATGAQEGADAPDGAETRPTPFLRPLKGPLRAVASARATPVVATPDPIDDYADAALGDWEEVMTPIIGPIEALVAASSSLEDVRAGLIDQLDRMDVSALATLLGRAGFVAAAAGAADVEDGQRDG